MGSRYPVLMSVIFAAVLTCGVSLLATELWPIALPIGLLIACAFAFREYRLLVSERKLRSIAEMAAKELGTSREQLSTVLESTSDGVIVLDQAGKIVFVNQRASSVIARPNQTIIGKTMSELYPAAGMEEFYVNIRKAIATDTPTHFQSMLPEPRIWLEVHAYPNGTGVSLFFRDISEARRSREELVRLAHHDILTGLANRTLLAREITKALRRGAGKAALLLIDLDEFTEFNDRLGHKTGDRLLVRVADRLSSLIGPNIVLSRVGGDEFALLFIGCASLVEARDLAEQVGAVLRSPLPINHQHLSIGVCIGIAMAPDHSNEGEALFRKADIALNAAKLVGRGVTLAFEQHLEDRVVARQALKADLGKALENRELEVVYQTIVDLGKNRVSGCEALLRWNHPERGMIAPTEFISLAEETGLIIPIGQWVLERACADAMEWPDNMSVSVNLSSRQFGSLDLTNSVAETLRISGLAPERLILEITESALLSDSAFNVAILDTLRKLGVKIALDDFGTGYSALSYLQTFRFDKIKIDRTFISDLGQSKESAAIVRAIAGLGQALSISITAEGVETRDQLQIVRKLGCHEAQGYLFTRNIEAGSVVGAVNGLNSSAPWRVLHAAE